MNKKIDNFDNFLLERKTKAERKLARAERKLAKAKEDFEEGKDNRATRRMEKAKELLADVKELDPELDVSKVETSVDNVDNVDWEKEFDISSSFLGKKLKSKDFKHIKKVKIKGNEISPKEAKMFLKSVKTYINQNWDDIKDGNDEEYLSTHSNNMVIDVKNKRNEVIFTYKEGSFDKAKLSLDKDIFDDVDNREELSDELEKLIDTESITGEEGRLSKNYVSKKDDKKVVPIATATIMSDKFLGMAEDP